MLITAAGLHGSASLSVICFWIFAVRISCCFLYLGIEIINDGPVTLTIDTQELQLNRGPSSPSQRENKKEEKENGGKNNNNAETNTDKSSARTPDN